MEQLLHLFHNCDRDMADADFLKCLGQWTNCTKGDCGYSGPCHAVYGIEQGGRNSRQRDAWKGVFRRRWL